jgi:predicted DNA binding protein
LLKQVELLVKGPNLLGDLSEKYACQLNMVDCRSFNDHSMSLLIEIEGERAKEMIHQLRQSQGIRRVFSAKGDSRKTLVMIVQDSTPYCVSAHESGAFCVTCPFRTENGASGKEGRWKLLLNDAEALKTVGNSLAQRGISMTVKDVSHAFHDELLTDRQKEIMGIAYKDGYFEFPRKNDLTEIAAELSIRPSTLSEILRRAEAKIVKHYVETMQSA